MSDELLPYYEKELAYVRQQGARFAEEHPKIAGRLGVSSDTIEDPHVSRLIESFAYLNARVHHKLDDDFSEISDALLGVLYPHYQRPLPSMTIVQFVPDREQLEGGYTIPARTLLETDQFQGENCRFTSIYDTEIFPLVVEEAKLLGRPFATPGANEARGANGVLHLRLKTFNETLNLQEIQPEKLRFFLKGQPQHINPLYELLFNECIQLAVANSEADVNPTYLPRETIKPVGFAESEGLLPYPASAFLGYRLITEFFAFPEKFLFFDLTGLKSSMVKLKQEINIYIYLKSSSTELERNLSASNFVLGCTPVVNLFEHQADPIKLDHKIAEYPLVPDMRRPLGYEVYSVDQVTGLSSGGERHEFVPLYGIKHQQIDLNNRAYWFAKRQSAKLGTGNRDDATDVLLSLVDLQLNPNLPDDKTLLIKTTCSNRNLPEKLPFSTEQPRLQCVEGSPPCEKIRCLIQPTRALRPALGKGARWRFLSHLNLNQLSLGGSRDALAALKEILRLYDFKDSSASRAIIESIIALDIHAMSAPLAVDGRTALCRGLEISLTIDDAQLSGSSSYLFATVLEHFFGLYCSVNSFTRLVARRKNKEGYLKKCSPRAGEKVLL